LKLYHQARTRSARVRWLLAELGVPYDLETVDVLSGAGRRPDYLKIHPHGFVPALEDDGTVLIESAAICMYLVDRYGGGRFAPAPGTIERGKYYEWMVYVPATADPETETIMFHTVFLPESHRLPQLVERSKKRWRTKIEPRYAAAVEHSTFILGDTFTAADVMVASSLAWAQMAGVLGNDPRIARYFAKLSERPGFRDAFAL